MSAVLTAATFQDVEEAWSVMARGRKMPARIRERYRVWDAYISESDVTESDLPPDIRSGLRSCVLILRGEATYRGREPDGLYFIYA